MRRAPADAASSYLPGSSPKLSPTFRPSTSSNFEPTSTRPWIQRLATHTSGPRGLIDTSVAVELSKVEIVDLSTRLAISSLTVAELVGGPHAANNEIERRRRQRHLRQVEACIEVLPFDAECAQAYGFVYAAIQGIGRKPRGAYAVDLMIAATALAHDLPVYTLNPKDLRGLENLIEVVDLG